jgi:thiol-disulfide isomerase/thioredoxin
MAQPVQPSAATPAPAANKLSAIQPKAAAIPAAYESDPKFMKAMEEAKQAKRTHQYVFAVDDYKKADKIAGGACKKCLESVYDLQLGLGSFKDAVATAAQLETLAASPRDKSIAEAERGEALLRQGGDKPKVAQLEAAHAVLQSALTDFPKNLSARWSDACVLAKMGKTDEASKEFSTCAASASPTDPLRMRAQHFAENPALSLSKMAPAFEVTALDGSRFNLDAMGGRVVLIDFWATWCGPCNEELPHMQKIAKEFAGQPLVIISVSWDSDEAKWKDFIHKHEMTWVQYRDAGHTLSERFGVQAIPHYFTIDSDGVLTAEMLGSGSDVEGKLKKLIKRANEAKAAAPQVALVATPPRDAAATTAANKP